MTKQNNIQLPKGWKLMTLGTTCHIQMGQSPPSSSYNTEKNGLPFFQGKAEFTKLHPVVEKWCNKPNRIAEPNDILLSVRAPIGPVNIANIRCAIGRGLASLRYDCYKYIFYFLRLNNGKLDNLGTGSTFRAISKNVLYQFPIPLPPLPEQRRIVAKIEELFSEIDKAVENLQKARQQIKTYRQSVLKHAFEGKLTAAWREGSKFKDHSLKLVAEPEVVYLTKNRLPEGWERETLKKCSSSIFDGPFGSHLKTSDYVENGIRVVRLENIKNLYFDDSKKSFVSSEKYEQLKRHTVFAGDLIFSTFISEETRVAVIPKTIEIAINKADCICVRVKKDFNLKFIEYFLSSRHTYYQLVKNIHGATRPRINSTQLKNVLIPLPEIKEQHQIVAEIEKRFSEVDKLEESIETALRQTEALRQSILKKAFEGKLIVQDENKANE